MAVPKRRTSKSRRDKRRTHKKTAAPNIAACPECGEAKQSHAACRSCGTYKGRTVLTDMEA
ncbi:50S ribosomal protein L32 [Desulfobotulus sp.]|jgi:large subunit ribosomal protein L32|uniref:50S ribosomal protein L32 n=1 Tax=Desulfobotulus sp. TaxID=1940337 RepID=UPI002A3707EF|nr:50S ribosomal protein L32 [Desulfobotulus sp.]MDY0163168.1 50S ribosomal protein L32 [Desulfobotulus sp.]